MFAEFIVFVESLELLIAWCWLLVGPYRLLPAIFNPSISLSLLDS